MILKGTDYPQVLIWVWHPLRLSFFLSNHQFMSERAGKQILIGHFLSPFTYYLQEDWPEMELRLPGAGGQEDLRKSHTTVQGVGRWE